MTLIKTKTGKEIEFEPEDFPLNLVNKDTNEKWSGYFIHRSRGLKKLVMNSLQKIDF